jgi:hypothetical protein
MSSFISIYTSTLFDNRENGFMTEADRTPKDPRETGKQLRPGLWYTVNERFPRSMIHTDDFVPIAELGKPLEESRLTPISSCGVHLKD